MSNLGPKLLKAFCRATIVMSVVLDVVFTIVSEFCLNYPFHPLALRRDIICPSRPSLLLLLLPRGIRILAARTRKE